MAIVKRFLISLILLSLLYLLDKHLPKPSQYQKLHTQTLNGFIYHSDMRLYGVEERWVINCHVGDCEDYALCIRDKLGKGEILIVRTLEGEEHAVLDVDGEIIDNLSKWVYKLEDMEHKLITRIPNDNPVFDNLIKYER